ncbi:PREDICTED: uncharacterized protein LOC104800187 isoform X2 [Tarenaya hassleriana]|nr:PREDICTED: uncharacterized protein LOC104800187 isoform X2 [Tarenaya hassleriana]
MDLGHSNTEPRRTGSFSLPSSVGSSSRHSLSLTRVAPLENDDTIDSERVSEAGDIGDRSLRRRHSTGLSSRFSTDHPIDQEEGIFHPSGLWGHDLRGMNTTSVISDMPIDGRSPLPTKLLLPSDVKDQEEPVLLKFLEYVCCLTHLAVFGILGVITRYLLQKLFGPTVARVTSDGSILYLDLPSNMVGSFLMGWFGVVFKADIVKVSEFLAIGLTTGYLGSLTTFSGWNQKMLDLSANGQWLDAILGFLLGLFLSAYSIIFGVETAKGFRWVLARRNRDPEGKEPCLKVNTFTGHMVSFGIMLVTLGVLLSVSAVLLAKEFRKGTSEAELWFGCLVAAPGVWLRWLLARLNGRGLGKGGRLLRWVPFGTLIANLSAAFAMAALATLKRSVKTRDCNTVASSIQFGLLGCLSTVSTLMAEFNAMRESIFPWRAYAYALFTISTSFLVGILLYSLPVWVLGFD